MRPIAVIEDDGLKDVLVTATQDRTFEMPSRYVTTKNITDLYQAKDSRIEDLLSKTSNVAFTIDYWTSVSNDSCLGIIAIFLVDWKLKSTTLGIEINMFWSHTPGNICEQVQSVINKWRLGGKMKYIVSDNAKNITKAVTLMKLTQMPCMAHSLQLAINTGIDAANIGGVLAKCRKIVGHYKHSTSKMAELKKSRLNRAERQMRDMHFPNWYVGYISIQTSDAIL